MKDKYAYPTISNLGPRPGMELRDWFAGQALVGLMSNPKYNAHDTDGYAAVAYIVADELLYQREQNNVL